jgi:hypothetical protein
MSFLNSHQPSVLIVAAKWWPLSARLAAALVQHRCRVSALCPTGHPLTYVSGLDRLECYVGTRSLASLARALRQGRIDIVIPCDDGVVAQLHTLYHQIPALRDLIERSLGHPQSFRVVSSRYQLLATAVELGIAVPETRSVSSAGDLISWHGKVAATCALKIDGESGGNGVRISGSLEQSLAAWRELRAPQSLATAWKRLAIDRDPLALWMRASSAEREITVQRLIHGRPANSMMACRNGEVVSLMSVMVLAASGPTGAATIIQRIQDDRMAKAATLLAKRLQLSGFFGLDFMTETDTGIPYLIEMNPRCTQLGHLEFGDQGSLVGAFIAELRGELPPPPNHPLPLDTIALYPQALVALGTGSRYRESSYLDVPWGEPRLVSELKLDPWPERRWAARLYHAVVPVNRPTPVEYQEETAGVVNPRSPAANDGGGQTDTPLAHENTALEPP